GHVLDVGSVVERLNQVLFGPEVVIGTAERYAGALGDCPHRRGLVAALAEQVERGGEDLRLRRGGSGLRRHAAPRSTSRTCATLTDNSSIAACKPTTGSARSARHTNPKFTR